MDINWIGSAFYSLAAAKQAAADLFTWGMILLVIVILIGSIVWSVWSSKKRREAMRQVATELSLTFVPDRDEFSNQLMSTANFDLFSRGSSHKMYNMLRGQRRDAEVALFDYQYTTGTTSKNRNTTFQTAVMFNLQTPELVQFTLKPRGLWEKVTSKLGAKEIDFSSAVEFTKKYLVKGMDETAIRRVFNPSVVAFFEAHPSLTVEANDTQLLVYRPGKRVKPEEMRSFLENAEQLLALMRKPRIDFGYSS